MKNLIEKFVGKTGMIHTGGLKVDVTVLDVKMSYGRERYLVTPVSGAGEVWVETIALHV